MASTWVASLVFVLVFIELGQTEPTEQASLSCNIICAAGYHKVRDCGGQPLQYQCKKCGHRTFTAINNTLKECLRCRTSSRYEVVVKECSSDSDAVFKCKDGYYYKDSNSASPERLCSSCYGTGSKKCQDCQRQECVNSSQCKKNCRTVPTPLKIKTTTTPTTPSVTPKTSTSTPEPRPKSTINSSNPAVNPVPQSSFNPETWLFCIVALVIFLVLSWFLLLVCRTFIRNHGCSCRSPNKVVETPAQAVIFNGRHNHHGSSPATLCEETPMIIQQPPAYICDQVPDNARMAVRQNKQPERWPAIVLYAIIKEVPLRRWKEFLRLLSVPDQQMERVELDASLGSTEKQYQMLRLWSQHSSASLNEVFSSLHHMDLLGCAQLLQESLERLQWRSEVLQGPKT